MLVYSNFVLTIKSSRLDCACAVNVKECGSWSVPGTLSMHRSVRLRVCALVHDDYSSLFLSVRRSTTTAIIHVHAEHWPDCRDLAGTRQTRERHFMTLLNARRCRLECDFSILKLQYYDDRLWLKYFSDSFNYNFAACKTVFDDIIIRNSIDSRDWETIW